MARRLRPGRGVVSGSLRVDRGEWHGWRGWRWTRWTEWTCWTSADGALLVPPPTGLLFFSYAFPRLTPWANFCSRLKALLLLGRARRPSGTGRVMEFTVAMREKREAYHSGSREAAAEQVPLASHRQAGEGRGRAVRPCGMVCCRIGPSGHLISGSSEHLEKAWTAWTRWTVWTRWLGRRWCGRGRRGRQWNRCTAGAAWPHWAWRGK